MKREALQNKKHWNNLSVNYSNAWKSKAREKLSEKELNFILKALDKKQQRYFLDVGVGTGRIMDLLIKNTDNNAELFGIDISEKMIEITRERFKKNRKIKNFTVVDVSSGKIPYKNKFDMITAIRVVKYSKNWQTSIRNLSNTLSPNGKLIFTMLNKRSINILGKSGILFYRTTVEELRRILQRENLKIIRMEGFSRLPDVLYFISENAIYIHILIFVENLLDKILGNIIFQKEIFIEARKNQSL